MANAAVETYDPAQNSVIVAGQLLQQFGPDTFISVTRPNDMWTSTEGVDGQVVRSKSNSKMAEIKVTLLGTSPSNDVLSALYTADEKTNAGLFPIFIRDASGTTTVFALQAWITKMPDLTRAKAVGTVEWTIHTGECTMFIGGNA